MAPEPRRKDRSHAREKPAGLEPAEERNPPPEEYTSYREVDAEDRAPESSEALREADLQPGTPKSRRPERKDEERSEG